MRSFSTQRGIVHVVPLLVLLVITGVAIWFFLNKGGLGTKGTIVPISPSQLMPFVSAQDARKTICNLKKEELFAQVCQSKFDAVGKEDVGKIAELFAILNKIQSDKSISDYERLLLAQVIFAALPTKNSPQANLYQPLLLSRLKGYLTSQNIAYAQAKSDLAQGQTMSEEELKLMERDLKNVVDSLPKGDNAWIIIVMASKYSWIDGKSQPLYADKYFESFDPFPNNPNVEMKDITYHVRSIIGSKASGQTTDSEMLAYSFAVVSWKSQEYTGKDGPVDEEWIVDRWDFSNANYWGRHYLTDLLDAVKMPLTIRQTKNPDEKKSKVDSLTDAQGRLTCEGMGKIMGSPECPHWSIRELSLWCAQSLEGLIGDGTQPVWRIRSPDYALMTDDMSCLSEEKKP